MVGVAWLIRRTFDVDPERFDNGTIILAHDRLVQCLRGLGKCIHLQSVQMRVSASGNGYHVDMECSGPDDCYNCRLVFDSPVRLELDLLRPGWTREVLWDRKVYRKGGGVMVGESGIWEMVE